MNDFRNSDNETYLRSYFSNPAYNDYPVVGVTWEQAPATSLKNGTRKHLDPGHHQVD